MDGSLQLFRHGSTVADESFHKLAVTIKYERLWNAVVIGEEKIRQRFIGNSKWVLNIKFARETRNAETVLLATNIQPYNLQALRTRASLELDKMRNG